MNALVVQQVAHEGPGLLAQWLPRAGLELDPVHPFDGDPLPARFEHDALVVLGGPMSADVGDEVIRAELRLLTEAVTAGVPVLGICLGAQLLALATGGSVRPGPVGPELGAGLVRRADVAATDPVFRSVPFLPDVVQWHWDEIEKLPPGAAWLAAGATYPHQAFRVGERAYGLQFHIEVGALEVARWAELDGVDPAAAVEGVATLDLDRTWGAAMAAFAGLAGPQPTGGGTSGLAGPQPAGGGTSGLAGSPPPRE